MPNSAESQPKRLSTLLMADIAASTKLVERDTDKTVSAWKAARRDIIEPALSIQHGCIVKFTGYGFLAEFPTVHDAVIYAMTMQAGLSGGPLTFRKGVNLGEVIDNGYDIHGERVNIAARIETLADPGCIVISGSVHKQVRNQVAADYQDMGERDLKHVSAPIRVFQIISFPNAGAPSQHNKHLPHAKPHPRIRVVRKKHPGSWYHRPGIPSETKKAGKSSKGLSRT